MHRIAARVAENRALGRGAFVLVLDRCEALAGARPGQFVMARADWGRDPLLPRAFSILRLRDGGICELLVKAIGRGTRLLEQLPAGAPIDLLGPLGSRFPVPADPFPGDFLVAGGVGLAPLLWFAEQTKPLHGHCMIYGARTAADLVLLDQVRAACAKVLLTTEDGSSPEGGPEAIRGRVTDALAPILPRRSAPGTRILTCGPNAMMKAVVELARDQECGRPPQPIECLLSVEGEMACGIGACLGCAVACPPGAPRAFRYACVDGPVFDAREVVLP